ncbi:MAG TPA: hypothetical protein VGN15_09645 [Ktedonobacteraceae bacterium]|jgi:hypothetical protein|nr:hypothetical protein [Ktedonobacteraceae bacterium]
MDILYFLMSGKNAHITLALYICGVFIVYTLWPLQLDTRTDACPKKQQNKIDGLTHKVLL